MHDYLDNYTVGEGSLGYWISYNPIASLIRGKLVLTQK